MSEMCSLLLNIEEEMNLFDNRESKQLQNHPLIKVLVQNAQNTSNNFETESYVYVVATYQHNHVRFPLN